MIIQSIPNLGLSSFNKQKINFTSTNTKQDSVSEPMSSTKNNEDDKNKSKKAYWKGVFAGIMFSALVIGGDRLIEYLIKKNAPKLK